MNKNNKRDELFLGGLLVLGLGILPFIFRKPPIKDWLLVYLWNAVTNIIIDHCIVSADIVRYPIRLLPKTFKSNVLFDFLLYPAMTIAYNQKTKDDKFITSLFKLLIYIVPMTIIEELAEKKTKLITFKKGWKWYHSFFSLYIKSLLDRLWIKWVRRTEEKQ
ncbi:CBO0543 family protein [Alteribacillus bidgolensis]|uniref:Uncharacterized protein n=1 Tax=Alteribacillus bidgolensis TaxID=930129 RepID=A0A1G8JCF5_9BACI|nr:CBO0543 family protein [Alteribacillus bidgolensis]SDI28964.1 hypothetical protein SAMN05216352_106147 [Alteribacillus bidgolensis]